MEATGNQMNNHFIYGSTLFSGLFFDEGSKRNRKSQVSRIASFIQLTFPPLFGRLKILGRRPFLLDRLALVCGPRNGDPYPLAFWLGAPKPLIRNIENGTNPKLMFFSISASITNITKGLRFDARGPGKRRLTEETFFEIKNTKF
jgi:hypothetical protein